MSETTPALAEARGRLERIEEAWSKSWDCSRDPGHALMAAALSGEKGGE